MNPNDNIIKTLDYLAQKIGIAIDWSAQNVLPTVGELCSRYIRYELIMSSCSLIIWSIVVGICIYIWYRCVKYLKNLYADDDYDILSSMLEVCAIILVPVLMICTVYFISYFIIPEIHDIITCLTLPELQIYEKLAELKNGIPS